MYLDSKVLHVPVKVNDTEKTCIIGLNEFGKLRAQSVKIGIYQILNPTCSDQYRIFYLIRSDRIMIPAKEKPSDDFRKVSDVFRSYPTFSYLMMTIVNGGHPFLVQGIEFEQHRRMTLLCPNEPDCIVHNS